MIKSSIEKIKDLYRFFVEDESLSGLNKRFNPFTFFSNKIGIGLDEGKSPREKIHLGKQTRIDENATINAKFTSRDFVVNSSSENLIVGNSSNSRVGIGTNRPTEKFEIRNGNLKILDTSTTLSSELVQETNFSSVSNWDLLGGFSLKENQSTGVFINDEDGVGTGDDILTVDGVSATKVFKVGDCVYKDDLDGTSTLVGTISSLTSTSITLAANSATAISNNIELFRKYVQYDHPDSLAVFQSPNSSREILNDGKLITSGGVTCAMTTSTGGGGASVNLADDGGVYNWAVSGDWELQPALSGGKAVYTRAGDTVSVLQQKVKIIAAPANSGARILMKLKYKISNSNIDNNLNYQGTTGAAYKYVYFIGFGRGLINTSNGTHTDYFYTDTDFTSSSFSADGVATFAIIANFNKNNFALPAGSTFEISNIELTEIPGHIRHNTSVSTVGGGGLTDGEYNIQLSSSNFKGTPSIRTGFNTFVSGIHAGISIPEGSLLSDSLIIPSKGGTNSLVLSHPNKSLYSIGNPGGNRLTIIVDSSSPGDSFQISNTSLKKIHSSVSTSGGDLSVGGSLTIGSGKAATDYTLTFDGETNDGVITWMEDEDYFKFGDDISAGWHGDASTIKILPRDFVGNEDAAGAAIHFDDTGTIGIIPSDAAMELYAFVPIPVGKKATHVSVFGNNTRPVTVFESNVNSGTHTSKGSGNVGTEIDITDFNHSATNYLTIKINTNATTNVIYGATVTIADIV